MRELTKTEVEAVAGGMGIIAIIGLAKTLWDIGKGIYDYFTKESSDS